MREVAELLGRAPMPPRWALGFLQSTRHFHDTAELRRLPRTIREKRIPCDGLIYLSTYGEALGWNRGVGHLEFQPELWPDPAGLLAEARDQHFELDHPRVPGAPRGVAAVRRGGVARATSWRRATSASARARARRRTTAKASATSTSRTRTSARWWWAAHRDLVASSASPGWWLDGGEGPPATATLHAGDGTLLHNIYDRLRHQAFAEGEAADRPDQRVFLLCRSGAAGHAALRRDVLVGRHQQRLRDPRGADPARAEHRPVRRAVLGHRHRRLLPSDPGDRRALRALVPARRLQPDLPLARLGLARARAVGARPRGRGDLPPLRRAALPAAALHLHAGLAGAHARAARSCGRWS